MIKQKILLLLGVIIFSVCLAIRYIENFLTPLALSSEKIAFSFIYLLIFCALALFWLSNRFFLPKFMALHDRQRLLILAAALCLALLLIAFRNDDPVLSINKIFVLKDYLDLVIFTLAFIFFGALFLKNIFAAFNRFFSDGTQNPFHWRNPKLYLIGFIGVYLSVNAYWLIKNTTPPWWDQSWYLQNSEFFYFSLRDHGIVSFAQTFVNSFGAKAPLLALLPLPWYWVGFHNYLGVILTLQTVTLVFFLVFFKFVSKIAGPWLALVAIVITGTMPLTYGLSRQVMVEFGLMLFVTLWMLLQVSSNHFENSRFNLGLGCVLGLGLLMKTTFPIYILGPAIIAGSSILRQKFVHHRSIRTYLKNIAVILLVGAVISGTWYWKNFSQVINFGLSAGLGEFAKDYSMGDPLALSTLLGFWKIVVNVAVSAFIFFAGILFLGLAVFRKTIDKHSPQKPILTWENKGVLLLWFLIPFIVFSLGVNKDYRYLLPALPALGTGIAVLIFMAIRTPRVRSIAIPITLVFPLFLMFYTSFQLPVDQKISFFGFDWVAKELDRYTYRPVSEKWPVTDIIEWIDKDAKSSYQTPPIPNPLVILIVDHRYFNNNNFGYYSTHMGIQLAISSFLTRSEEQWQEQKDHLDSAQYIITKTGDQGPSFTTNMNIQIQKSLAENELPFTAVMQYDLPDGSLATIFRRH